MILFCACVCCCSCVFTSRGDFPVRFFFVFVLFYSPWKYFCTSLLLSIWGVYTNWGLFFIHLWVACAKFKSSHLKIINNCNDYNSKQKSRKEKKNRKTQFVLKILFERIKSCLNVCLSLVFFFVFFFFAYHLLLSYAIEVAIAIFWGFGIMCIKDVDIISDRHRRLSPNHCPLTFLQHSLLTFLNIFSTHSPNISWIYLFFPKWKYGFLPLTHFIKLGSNK